MWLIRCADAGVAKAAKAATEAPTSERATT
jgi:hypothetical protein